MNPSMAKKPINTTRKLINAGILVLKNAGMQARDSLMNGLEENGKLRVTVQVEYNGDDKKSDEDKAKRLLEQAGYEVISVRSGASGFRISYSK